MAVGLAHPFHRRPASAGVLLAQTYAPISSSSPRTSSSPRSTESATDISDVHHQVIEEFISAPSGWNPQAAKLAECEWEEIKPLFDGLQREKFNLGQATLDFYDEREPDLLSDDDQ